MKLSKLMKCIDANTNITLLEPSDDKYVSIYTCQRAVFIAGEYYHRKVIKVYPYTYNFTQREGEECLMIVLGSED